MLSWLSWLWVYGHFQDDKYFTFLACSVRGSGEGPYHHDYERQILTSKVDSRTVRVNPLTIIIA